MVMASCAPATFTCPGRGGSSASGSPSPANEGGRSLPSLRPSGLRHRLLAFARDYLVILVYLVPLVGLGAIVHPVAPAVTTTLSSGPFGSQTVGFVLVTLPDALYFALSDFSAGRSTWGKCKTDLAVCFDLTRRSPERYTLSGTGTNPVSRGTHNRVRSPGEGHGIRGRRK